VAKKEEPKGKEKAKEEPKGGGDDKEAAELLSKAKVQISLKQTDKAKATLNEVIEKYPDTKAAAEAKKLLEKVGK
jgi:TolA-binding protein